jgi:hypothetical protein
MNQKENAISMRNRIKLAKTLCDISKIERAMDRLWNIGAFKTGDAMKLHDLIMERLCFIERGDA